MQNRSVMIMSHPVIRVGVRPRKQISRLHDWIRIIPANYIVEKLICSFVHLPICKAILGLNLKCKLRVGSSINKS